jgi:hypothetical protein
MKHQEEKLNQGAPYAAKTKNGLGTCPVGENKDCTPTFDVEELSQGVGRGIGGGR